MNKTGKVNQPGRAPMKKGFGDRAIRFKCSMQNTILDVLRSRGWVEVKEDDTDFDLFWADRGWMREYFDQCFMEDHVRINHFRNHYELTRKNLMVKNLKRYKKNLDREVGKLEAAKCDFFPTTFELPMRSQRRKQNAEISAQEWIKSKSGDPPGFSVKPVSPLIEAEEDMTLEDSMESDEEEENPSVAEGGSGDQSVPDSTTHIAVSPDVPVRKRRPWSCEEKDAILRHLSRHMLLGRLPGKREIEQAIQQEQALSSRSWRNVKDFCRNQMVSKAKRM